MGMVIEILVGAGLVILIVCVAAVMMARKRRDRDD